MFGRKKKRMVVFEDSLNKHIPLPVLIRQTIYDTMLMPAEEIAEAMGLPPISEEVSEMEERASQERLERFAHLIPFIDSHAEVCSKIAIAAYLIEEEDSPKEEKYTDEDVDSLIKMFRLVSLSATMSCLSTLFNLELIQERDIHSV